MPKVIVAEVVTLDGRMQDPDGSGGTAGRGRAFRYGVDEFRLMAFPTVLGTGRRLFDGSATPFDLVLSEDVGAGGMRIVHSGRSRQ